MTREIDISKKAISLKKKKRRKRRRKESAFAFLRCIVILMKKMKL